MDGSIEYIVKCYSKNDKRLLNLLTAPTAIKVKNILKDLNSKLIMKYYGSCETNEFYYEIYHYTPGQDLFSYVNSHRISDIECRNLFYTLLRGLEILHEHHILHLDIKPENIIVNSSEDHLFCTIIDFDKSILFDEDIKLDNFNVIDYIGTVGYAAPEILKCESINYSADIWSAGITYFTMLTGKNLFMFTTPKQILTRLQMIDITQTYFTRTYGISNESSLLLYSILEINPRFRISLDELIHLRVFNNCPQLFGF
ncbi:hypothetical protein WA158_002513 [Blastocystis sp. Blastoise]